MTKSTGKYASGDTTNITIRVPTSKLAEVKDAARLDGRSMANFIAWAAVEKAERVRREHELGAAGGSTGRGTAPQKTK